MIIIMQQYVTFLHYYRMCSYDTRVQSTGQRIMLYKFSIDESRAQCEKRYLFPDGRPDLRLLNCRRDSQRCTGGASLGGPLFGVCALPGAAEVTLSVSQTGRDENDNKKKKRSVRRRRFYHRPD